jgi:glutamate racemase
MRKITNYRMMVLDWGIGGLPLFQGLLSALPDAGLLYLSDSGSAPYGKQSAGELRGRLEKIAAFAAGLGIGTVALACNAMSSVLPAAGFRMGGVEVLSLIHAFIASPLPSGRVIGVIGGVRTINSGIYQRALEAAGNRVRALPTQDLSALIEAGDFAAVPAFLEKTLAALGNIDTLVLACTHYSAVSPFIKNIAGGLEITDPGSVLYDACLMRLSALRELRPGGGLESMRGRQRYITTGSAERTRLSAEAAFGFSGLPFETIAMDLSPAGLAV